MYKYFNLLNNKVTPVICEKVLHCFGLWQHTGVSMHPEFHSSSRSTALLAPFKQYFCLSCSIRGAHKGH